METIQFRSNNYDFELALIPGNVYFAFLKARYKTDSFFHVDGFELEVPNINSALNGAVHVNTCFQKQYSIELNKELFAYFNLNSFDHIQLHHSPYLKMIWVLLYKMRNHNMITLEMSGLSSSSIAQLLSLCADILHMHPHKTLLIYELESSMLSYPHFDMNSIEGTEYEDISNWLQSKRNSFQRAK